ncbi:MAG TPA: hypothetical protein VK335_03230 [Bryobacteraceae bacterium]|nr:hypothetical protein [Bryobacteraceae bacterium]
MRWLLLVTWICGAVHASAIPRLPLAEMADGSEYIVEATVLRSWTAWDAPHRFIWTHYELSVNEWLKAPVASDRTIVVSEPGGTADGITMLADDATPYTLGEKVVVLAWRTPEGFLRAAGNGQGKFTVTGFAGSRERRLRWSPHVIDILRDAREPDERLDGMRLDDFKIYVRRFLRFEGERRTAE